MPQKEDKKADLNGIADIIVENATTTRYAKFKSTRLGNVITKESGKLGIVENTQRKVFGGHSKEKNLVTDLIATGLGVIDKDAIIDAFETHKAQADKIATETE